MDQRWQNSTPTVKDQFKYGYDRASNRTWRENTLRHNGGGDPKLDEFYTYDGLDRLETMKRGTLTGSPPYTGIADTPANEEDWTLDALGNWKGFRVDDDSTLDWDVLDQTRLHNKVNEIDDDNDHLPGDPINEGTITETQGDSWVVPGYDAAGNMLSGPKPGNETVRQHCKWDAWNRMVAVYADDDQNPGEPGDLVATYRYDGLNRRIQKIVEGSPDVTYDYYYNESWQIVEVRKDSDTDPLEQYVWDIRYIDAPVVRFRDGNTDGDLTGGTQEGDNTLYFTNDANMNVTALVDASDGATVERYTYDPYGKPTVLNGVRDSTGTATTEWTTRSSNTFQNSILYCGYRFDSETGLYHVRHRYYHPTLGRWTGRDEEFYDGMTLYQYVRSNPVNLTDPSGMAAAGDSGSSETQTPACCCVSEPEKCYIEIELVWSGAPSAKWILKTEPTGAEAPRWNYGKPPQPKTKQVPYLTFGAEAHATVTLKHKENKDVTGCHLRQDVEAVGNWNLADAFTREGRKMRSKGRVIKITHPWKTSEPYTGETVSGDYNSQYSGLSPRIIATYHDWWYEDYPNVSAKSVRVKDARALPNPARYWFQAHVYVEESTTVENWWGFDASFADLQKESPRASGNLWKDSQKEKPDYAKPKSQP